ncbi:hypothetical protein L596_009077 [Steinernema carpocapsae]|uniref:Uncharacterized protein n=1 Tax=Steinernema carpocapsae TaxID=34508 RepID=A0A4U5PED7_STECR|nr:hypothetical protein L596_009077 [Steinernema carpocapsae]
MALCQSKQQVSSDGKGITRPTSRCFGNVFPIVYVVEDGHELLRARCGGALGIKAFVYGQRKAGLALCWVLGFASGDGLLGYDSKLKCATKVHLNPEVQIFPISLSKPL